MTEFEKSVCEIVGLTMYTDGTLPKWMRERLIASHDAKVVDRMTDAELVAGLVSDEWLRHWGNATIDGHEVMVPEQIGNHFLGFEKAAEFALWMNCGFLLVDRATHTTSAVFVT